MLRKIIKIDEEKCNGCGLCIPECHEGALQIIDGKARLISDLFCDGLGACLGHCPEDAITIEEREAIPYNETKVMETISKQGTNTIVAHLDHLKDHNETALLDEALQYIHANQINVNVDTYTKETVKENDRHSDATKGEPMVHFAACPGAASREFSQKQEIHTEKSQKTNNTISAPSELTHWPVQLHLINPGASHFRNADILLAADCVAFTMGNFHEHFLKEKKLAIACPKLDSNKEIYIEKLIHMIDQSEINTLTVVVMEVPCCSGLLQLAKIAVDNASRKVPIKKAVIGIQGKELSNTWS